ncbi:hypothetical protein GLYMA_08G240700v4 [Glycine max]|nr:hypothetical protein GLYMA_08G240700v4 [Glycine max]KAH1052839.1 hypothetical protein GYH30_022229 [Glycine max]
MGCASSKKTVAGAGGSTPEGPCMVRSSSRRQGNNGSGRNRKGVAAEAREGEAREWSKGSLRGGTGSVSLRLSCRFVEAEQNAAGWPPWLTSVAGEAIQGWVPLKTDSFERLDKIGQGTYSSVFQAREVETGRMVALKKVRFDKLQAESIRFMAREILILRTLDHPNIMKLEGIITSQLSNSIYLVFEYMEHDLAGLVASPDIKFTDSQVEQLHKIFKLCGSPPEEFWKKNKLPLATMFKPKANYETSLQERCRGFPATAVNLLETLLSIDPSKRRTASSALMSEYFSTKPYACNPSHLPKYPPSKEMDAKNREEVRRKKNGGKVREAVTSKRQRQVHKVSHDHINFNQPALKENVSQNPGTNDGRAYVTKGKVAGAMHKEQPKPSYDAKSEAAQVVNGCNGYSVYSGPAPISGSSGFTWAKRRKPKASSILSDGSRSKVSALDPTFAKGTYDLTEHGIEVSERKHSYNTSHRDETSSYVSKKYQAPLVQQKSFDVADTYNSNYYMDFDFTDKMDALIDTQGHRKHDEPVEQSVPNMIPSNKNEELLHWNENDMRQSLRKSRLGRDQ